MATNTTESRQKSLSVFNIGLRYLILAILAAIGSIAAIQLFTDGFWQLGIMIVVITVFFVIIFIN